MSHTHRQGGPTCRFPTKKACEDWVDDVAAARQVLLAERIVAEGRVGPFRKSKDVFGQLVLVVAGEKPDITNKEGNPGEASFTRRLRRVLQMRVDGAGRESNPPS